MGKAQFLCSFSKANLVLVTMGKAQFLSCSEGLAVVTHSYGAYPTQDYEPLSYEDHGKQYEDCGRSEDRGSRYEDRLPILGLMVSALPILKPMKTVLSSKSTRALLSVKEGLTAVPPLMEIFLCKNALRITPALSLLEIIATGLIFGIYHGLHLVCVLGLLGVPKMW
eukprot:CAMPEP_0172410624 /NCGR_PEP_ID=MMETSP1061-20121228/76978_1 /TAXON_ID=37318 /ORGANISM="Pseudo-nitzschia pungens, Strain cf. pungens" /LENGTH=166 /DNA_ID=CAMNT_0013146817 /DNA_START=441 /DNA_END=939 /DNA_ORIENTATION=-